MLAMTGVVLLPVVAFVSLRIKHVIANAVKQSIPSLFLKSIISYNMPKIKT